MAGEDGNQYVWGYIPVVVAKVGLYLKENGELIRRAGRAALWGNQEDGYHQLTTHGNWSSTLRDLHMSSESVLSPILSADPAFQRGTCSPTSNYLTLTLMITPPLLSFYSDWRRGNLSNSRIPEENEGIAGSLWNSSQGKHSRKIVEPILLSTLLTSRLPLRLTMSSMGRM